jgi:hypothetical protein
MSTPLVTALSGMVGSVVGVSATIAMAWIKQKTVDERELLREEIRKRETLYGEFIGECARLLVDAFQHTLEKPETMLAAYALLNRIRLCGSHEVLASAGQLLTRITDEYFSANRTVQELQELAHSSEADPLKGFGEACRTELKALREHKSLSRARTQGIRQPLDGLRRSPISDQTPTLL